MGTLIFLAGFVAYFVIRYRSNIGRTFREFEEFRKAKVAGSFDDAQDLSGEHDDWDEVGEFNLKIWSDDEKQAS